MAENNGKTKIILTVVIGLFGVMCFGFALTVTDKYKKEREKAAVLERKFVAGVEELVKIPKLQEAVANALGEAKNARSAMDDAQEELDETTEELDEVYEELEAAQAELEEGAGGDAAESVDNSEMVAALDEANALISSLNEENESLMSDLDAARKAGAESGDGSGDSAALAELEAANNTIASLNATIDDLKSSRADAKGSTPSGSIGFTYNGLFSADPNPGDRGLRSKVMHRGLGEIYRKPAHSSACASAATTACAAPLQTEEHIAIINARITELSGYAESTTVRSGRIGAKAYSAAARAPQESRNKVSTALKDILGSYTNLLDLVSGNDSLKTWQKGFAKNSLNKRVSSYVCRLMSINEAGEFSDNKREVTALLSKIQGEQRYFTN